MTINENFEEAFNEWWEPDPDEGYTDLPYPDIDKEKQRAIFLAGYLWGSRKPVYQMSVTQYTAIVKAIEGKIRDERWVGLTPDDMPDGEDPMYDHPFFTAGMVWAANTSASI